MRNLFRILGNIFNAVWPYAYTFILFFILFGVEARTALEVKELKAQEEQNATDTATYYDAVLQLDMALAQADVQIAKNLDKIKADEAKQNDAIIRTIYAVDKKADARADAIVYGVNKVVDGVNYALQKPSYNYLKNIIVKIIGRAKDYETAPPGKRGWMGTGVIIAVTDKATYILTNRHVMGQYGDGTHDYYVKEGEEKYTLTAVKISDNEAVDLALVKVEGKIEGKVAVRGFGKNPNPQDPVYMVGMDLGRPFFYSEGTVSGFDPSSQDELVVGMPVGPGNSGSAVIDKDGGLVGLLYAGSIIDQEGIEEMDVAHGLCVPLKAIKLFLASYVS